MNEADRFYSTHNIGHTPFPFPRDLFLSFIAEHNGYFPVIVEAIADGTVVSARTPVYQIFAAGKYSRLITFLETILTQLWYPTTVATLSRRAKDLIAAAFDTSSDNPALIDSRLHDFGMRGCTCVEQTIIGGCAHLLSFTGSDTMSAGYYAQHSINRGKPVSVSIPATEHSVMTSWSSEEAAILNMIDQFGGAGKVFAVVMDSYDYTHALTVVLPAVKAAHIQKGGTMILRPDSGNPVDCVLEALRAGEACFGAAVNSKGYKVIPHMGVIQGDGIDVNTIESILAATLAAGYAADNVAFGMGGGLLQRVNRDCMSFATKLSCLTAAATGEQRDVMKRPKTDAAKVSYPGVLSVHRDETTGCIIVLPRELTTEHDTDPHNLLRVVYNHGPVATTTAEAAIGDNSCCRLTFDQLRLKVSREWSRCPKVHNVMTPQLQRKIDAWIANYDSKRATAAAKQ